MQILNQDYSGDVVLKNSIGEYACRITAGNELLNISHIHPGIYVAEPEQNNMLIKTVFIKL